MSQLLCEFAKLDATTYRCHGGWIVRNATAPPYGRCSCFRLFRLSIGTPCSHLGAVIRLETCETCRGHVETKIYACAVHKEVPLSRCQECPDRTPRPVVRLRLHHGLGDAVQFTSVLRHLTRYYPQYDFDVRAPYPELFGAPKEACDLSLTINWPEPAISYSDSPSTKAERCLRETFGIRPDPQLSGYHVEPSGTPPFEDYVLIHYQADGLRHLKDIDEGIMRRCCEVIRSRRLTPVVIDRQSTSRLGDVAELLRADRLAGPGYIAALAQRAALCIGIDSGPGHIFAAQETPTIIVANGMHPLRYFCPAPHCLFIVRRDHENSLLPPVNDGLAYFQKHYRNFVTSDDAQLVGLVDQYLIHPGLHSSLTHRNVWLRLGMQEPDKTISKDVIDDDCYALNELPITPRTILDVGAHIGCFAVKANGMWPARIGDATPEYSRICCVEANPKNIPALKLNTAGFASIISAACTYEANQVGLLDTIFDGTANTGGSTVATIGSPRWDSATVEYERCAEPLPKITLEQIAAQHGWTQIDLLKLDCEGSEFSILENCDLSLLRFVVGEYHDRQRFDVLVRERFRDWNLRILREGTIGVFWLWKQS